MSKFSDLFGKVMSGYGQYDLGFMAKYENHNYYMSVVLALGACVLACVLGVLLKSPACFLVGIVYLATAPGCVALIELKRVPAFLAFDLSIYAPIYAPISVIRMLLRRPPPVA